MGIILYQVCYFNKFLTLHVYVSYLLSMVYVFFLQDTIDNDCFVLNKGRRIAYSVEEINTCLEG